MKFYTWDARTDFLLRIAQEVEAKFGEYRYNVFVFGSFIREDYDPRLQT